MSDAQAVALVFDVLALLAWVLLTNYRLDNLEKRQSYGPRISYKVEHLSERIRKAEKQK